MLMRCVRALAGYIALVMGAFVAQIAPLASAAEVESTVANLRFTYPDSWVLVWDGSRGGPITVATTADANMGNAAGIRIGAAVISVLFPPPARTETSDRTIFEDVPTIKSLVMVPGGSDAPGRLEYEDHSAGPNSVTRNVRVYRRVGTRTIVVALEFNHDDPRASDFLQIQSGLVDTLVTLAQ